MEDAEAVAASEETPRLPPAASAMRARFGAVAVTVALSLLLLPCPLEAGARAGDVPVASWLSCAFRFPLTTDCCCCFGSGKGAGGACLFFARRPMMAIDARNDLVSDGIDQCGNEAVPTRDPPWTLERRPSSPIPSFARHLLVLCPLLVLPVPTPSSASIPRPTCTHPKHGAKISWRSTHVMQAGLGFFIRKAALYI